VLAAGRLLPKKRTYVWRVAATRPPFVPLLHEFNVEFGEWMPDAKTMPERPSPLIERDEVTPFAGEGPDGFAELRFRPSLCMGALDAYFEERHVVPGTPRSWFWTAMEPRSGWRKS
jgi:hypothetical protein